MEVIVTYNHAGSHHATDVEGIQPPYTSHHTLTHCISPQIFQKDFEDLDANGSGTLDIDEVMNDGVETTC